MVDENKQRSYANSFQYYEINCLNWDSNREGINGVEIDNHATNNPSYIFNSWLNELISIKKPHISYLTSCLFQMRQLSHARYYDNIGSPRRPGVNGNIFAERIRRFDAIVKRFIYSFNMEEIMNDGLFKNLTSTYINDKNVGDDVDMGLFDELEDDEFGRFVLATFLQSKFKGS